MVCFFSVSLLVFFSPSLCGMQVYTTYCTISSITPASEGEAERGCRQAGGKDRVETVWSHAATTGSTGRNAQPGGCVQGVAGHSLSGPGCLAVWDSGVRTARRIAHAAQYYLPRTVSHHSTPDHFLFIYCGIIIHPLRLDRPAVLLGLWWARAGSLGLCAAASISAQVGWRPAAMTRTKGGS